MYALQWSHGHVVNHHTGGLEKTKPLSRYSIFVNHHTGGLEIVVISNMRKCVVNHHTGGLETANVYHFIELLS